jgi:hypothetical protein
MFKQSEPQGCDVVGQGLGLSLWQVSFLKTGMLEVFQSAESCGEPFVGYAASCRTAYATTSELYPSIASIAVCMMLAEVFYVPARFMEAKKNLSAVIKFCEETFPDLNWKTMVPPTLVQRVVLLIGDDVAAGGGLKRQRSGSLVRGGDSDMPPPATTPTKRAKGAEVATV